MKIADYLNTGRAGAVPLRHLEAVTDLDGRVIRQMIANERKKGVPILSDNVTGYWLSASEEETNRFLRSMRHRANEIITACNALEKKGD